MNKISLVDLLVNYRTVSIEKIDETFDDGSIVSHTVISIESDHPELLAMSISLPSEMIDTFDLRMYNE